MIKKFLVFAFFQTTLSAVACAQEAYAIAHYNNWSVFKDDAACWVATLGKSNASDAAMALDTTFAYATFHGGNIQPIISFELGAMVREDMTVQIGNMSFDLFVDEQALFTYREDIPLLRQMLANRSMRLGDDDHNVEFDLGGFQDAYSYVAKICDFRSIDLDKQTQAARKG